MKIKMLTLMAGPGGVRQPGKVYDLPPAEAAALIEARVAEKVTAEAASKPAVAAPRTAARRGGRTGDKPDAGADPATSSETDADPQESQA